MFSSSNFTLHYCSVFGCHLFWLWTSVHTQTRFSTYSVPRYRLHRSARQPDTDFVLRCTLLFRWCPWALWPQSLGVAGQDPTFSPSVPINIFVADGGAEFSSKEDIHVKRRFAVYVERISLRVVTVGVSSPQGWRCSWLQWPQDPPGPSPWQCQTPRWDRLSACQLQGQRRLIVWSDLFWWNLCRVPLLSLCLWLRASLLLFSLIESFHWCLWQNKVPLGKERASKGDWERETKNNS